MRPIAYRHTRTGEEGWNRTIFEAIWPCKPAIKEIRAVQESEGYYVRAFGEPYVDQIAVYNHADQTFYTRWTCQGGNPA